MAAWNIAIIITNPDGKTMKYAELNSLWIKQDEAYREWHRELFTKVSELRQSIIDAIEPPEKWTEPEGGTHPYISIVAIAQVQEGQPKHLTRSNMETTENGDCAFGVSFTFDHGVDRFPKSCLYIPVVIRFEKRIAQYCLWDTQQESIADGENWSDDKAAFINTVLEKFAEALAFNPKDGLQNKPKIGFIQN